MKENKTKTKKVFILFKKKAKKINKKKRKDPKWGSLWSHHHLKKHPPLEDLQTKTKKTCKLEVPP